MARVRSAGLGVICGLSLLLVLVLAPRFFSPGTPVFPSVPSKTNDISKFQFDLDYCQALYHAYDPLAREIAQALPVLLTLNKLLCTQAFRYYYSVVLKDGSNF